MLLTSAFLFLLIPSLHISLIMFDVLSALMTRGGPFIINSGKILHPFV